MARWVGENLFKQGFAQAVASGDAKTGGVLLRGLDKLRRAVGIKNSPSARDIAMLERLVMQAMENRTGTRSGEGVQYSIRQTSKMDYREQLALIENGRLNGSNSLYIGKPSEELHVAGLKDAPFVMNQSDYRKSRRSQGNNKHYSSHAVPYSFFEEMPQHLADAPMLIDNGGRVTVITAVPMNDTNGAKSYIIAGILRNRTMEGDDIHQVKSVYPLDDFKNRITKAAKEGRLVVLNKNKVNQMLATIGVQPSELSSVVNLAKSSLTQTDSIVKDENTQSAYLPEDRFVDRMGVENGIPQSDLTVSQPPLGKGALDGDADGGVQVDEAAVLERPRLCKLWRTAPEPGAGKACSMRN